MGLLAVNHHQSFARSLSAIHHQQSCDDSDSDGSHINVSKRDRNGKALHRRQSSPREDRCTSRDTAPPAPSGRRVTFAHPFSGDGLAEHHISTSQERQPRKFQRRRSTATNSKVTEEKRKERRNLMEARILEDHFTGFRRDYELGETIRCPSHMATEEIDTLKNTTLPL